MDINATQELIQQQALEKYTERLVTTAEETISDQRMNDMRRSLKTAQLSNLLAVAQQTTSPAAVANWVRYQMGRGETRRAWKQSGLGDDILRRIEEMSRWAQEAGQTLYGKEVTAEQIMALHVALIRQYVGYLRRWFVAKGGQN